MKNIFKLTIIVLTLYLFVKTGYKIYNDHNDNLLKVSAGYITGAARKCTFEHNCNTDMIPLSTLYQLGYVKDIINPVTKKEYNMTSYVKKEDNNYRFVAID